MTDLKTDLKATLQDPRYWPDEEVERRARAIIEQLPIEDDDSLDPKFRAAVQKCRKIFERRDNEPTPLREGK